MFLRHLPCTHTYSLTLFFSHNNILLPHTQMKVRFARLRPASQWPEARASHDSSRVLGHAYAGPGARSNITTPPEITPMTTAEMVCLGELRGTPFAPFSVQQGVPRPDGVTWDAPWDRTQVVVIRACLCFRSASCRAERSFPHNFFVLWEVYRCHFLFFLPAFPSHHHHHLLLVCLRIHHISATWWRNGCGECPATIATARHCPPPNRATVRAS